MARIKDLTGDLGRLRDRNPLPERASGPQSELLERPMAINGSGVFAWSCVGAYLVLQLAFMVWLVLA